jgi:hypothetical protein
MILMTKLSFFLLSSLSFCAPPLAHMLAVVEVPKGDFLFAFPFTIVHALLRVVTDIFCLFFFSFLGSLVLE